MVQPGSLEELKWPTPSQLFFHLNVVAATKKLNPYHDSSRICQHHSTPKPHPLESHLFPMSEIRRTGTGKSLDMKQTHSCVTSQANR